MKKIIENLLSSIRDIVDNNDMPWAEKRKALIEACDTEDAAALGEFVSWFDGEIAP